MNLDYQNLLLKIIEIKVEEKPTGEISAGAGVGTHGTMTVSYTHLTLPTKRIV